MNLLLFNLRVDRDDTALGFTTDWINELARHFEKISVITMFAGAVVVAPNVRVLSVGQEKGYSKPRRVLEFYRHLFRVLREDHYDTCFAHMMPLFAAMGAPVLKARRIPIVLWYAHNHRSAMLRIANPLVDRALSSVQSAYPIKTRKLRIIGQGIDTHRFLPRSPQNGDREIVYYTIGRISRVKRLETLIEAFAVMRKARPDIAARLRFVGDCRGPGDEAYRDALAAATREAGLTSRVEFLPSVPFYRVHEVHWSGDVFLHANDNGLDKALLEAMSCAVPTVSCHPAMANVLQEWAAKTPEDIAARMIRLADMNNRERAYIGEMLREHILERHSLSALGIRIAEEAGSLGVKRRVRQWRLT